MATFTEKLKTLFIDTLRETCNVTVAAQTVGINSGTAYRHRKEDPIFAEQWDEALQEGIDLLEQKAHERAFNGVDKGIYHQGMMVGTEKQYSDGLTMFLLKAHRPDKYRERSSIDQNVSGGMSLIIETGVPRKPTPTDDLV